MREGLKKFISHETLTFFSRFGIQTDFLLEDPKIWHANPQYQKGLKIVQSLKVVNDTAERGVKLMSDFNDLITREEDQKQFVLQVVSDCRRLYPDFSKSSLSIPLPTNPVEF